MKPARVVLVVAALLGAAFIAGFFYIVNDDESAMVAGGALFFGRLSDGKVDEAYDTAGEPLRVDLERQDIHFLAEDLKRFGRFRKIINVTRLEKGSAGGKMEAIAQFEKAEVPTKLAFLRKGRTWKVAGVELSFPEGAFPEPDEAALLEAAAGFDKAFEADDRLKVYNALDPIQRQSLKPSQFDSDMERLHGSCGKMTVGAPAAAGPVEPGAVIVEASVMCDKRGHFSLKTKWQWQRTRWRLFGLSWTDS